MTNFDSSNVSGFVAVFLNCLLSMVKLIKLKMQLFFKLDNDWSKIPDYVKEIFFFNFEEIGIKMNKVYLIKYYKERKLGSPAYMGYSITFVQTISYIQYGIT